MKYVIVEWPFSQILMDKEWFDECILINDEPLLSKVGSSAYFVPEHRLKEISEGYVESHEIDEYLNE
jgi:hypothetical protein